MFHTFTRSRVHHDANDSGMQTHLLLAFHVIHVFTMATTETICIQYEGHQVPVPYDAVNMIVIAKESSGTSHEARPTFTDEYIARVLKYWPRDLESAGKYDYRVLMDKKVVQQIYQGVLDRGGLWRSFPDVKPLEAANVLSAMAHIVLNMHDWRGLDQSECDAVYEINGRWQDALAEEMKEEEETNEEQEMKEEEKIKEETEIKEEDDETIVASALSSPDGGSAYHLL